ncbi:MAG: S8 family serine peptidase [bacterium]
MKYLRLSLLLLIAIFFAYIPAVGQENRAAQTFQQRMDDWIIKLNGLEYVTDEVIVEFEDARSLCSIDGSQLAGYDIDRVFQYRAAAVFKIIDGESVPSALARLGTMPGIKSVSPNGIWHTTLVPNDPLYNSQAYFKPLKTEAGWDVSVGSFGTTVAVLDSGIDDTHPEFGNRIAYRENFVDPKAGVNNVFDDTGHGTASAGLIGAKGNNNTGIAGMAWDIKFMIIRVCGGPGGGCRHSDVAMGIDSAVAHGADVINLSLGGRGSVSIMEVAVKEAYKAGVTLVASAGNDGAYVISTGNSKVDKENMYFPAGYPEVIGVSALDNAKGAILKAQNLTRASFSNYGEDIVSVGAVGTKVLSTVPIRPLSEIPNHIYTTPGYDRLNGTSFSGPQVAGLAALVLSVNPGLSPDEVRKAMENNAVRLNGPDLDGNGIDDYFGYGVIDVAATLGSFHTGPLSIHETDAFKVGICASPVMPDDFIIIVECKTGCDFAPTVYFDVADNDEAGFVTMDPLPNSYNRFVGRFHTNASGNVTIRVAGDSSGNPLQEMAFSFVL